MVKQAAQILGKPDLAPTAWVKRLVTLCDQAPVTPFPVVQRILEDELGKKVGDVFERFDIDPVGSASIAQVEFSSWKFSPLLYFKCYRLEVLILKRSFVIAWIVCLLYSRYYSSEFVL